MRRTMVAAQQLQQIVVPRLNAEADAGDTEPAQQRCLLRGYASRIRLHRPIDQFGQIELLPKSAEQKFQLRRG